MYGSDKVSDEADRTAFRRAEKKYKLYYKQDSKFSKKKKQPKQVDLSDVLDFKSALEDYINKGVLPQGIRVTKCGLDDTQVFYLENHPGFYFIPGALGLEEQCKWIKESLANFPQPPNRTNHNAIYGPISNLFDAAKENMVLVREDNQPDSHDPASGSCISNGEFHSWKFVDEDFAKAKGKTWKTVPASVLLRKLRWSTLGLQFDWSKRNYDISLPHNKIPDALCQLVKRLAAIAMPVGEEFSPEAAIVNYFGLGDTLGGHLDDMERDWSKPIVSMSLGCKAIFLLGGKSREEPPQAMFLRSGDVVLMAGEARECFHGVPRVFTDEENAEIGPLESALSHGSDSSFLEYIKTSRININIRQVF
ncbi:PREDICTED: alpha-ketoglutarate-dependent dioxygenase alkB [Tarenaya hassleriana]|uniref:alpha-ketoglutarate-dependent dioxygenase alkB n=1 Tax=Tarenaya hassleriana TaxID=28532 RepID=UPI00053C6339|nr:PREDICTED: alpha-ketoglutarate-dependent dioxygenase alkB [Tarenaya hassleriana]